MKRPTFGQKIRVKGEYKDGKVIPLLPHEYKVAMFIGLRHDWRDTMAEYWAVVEDEFSSVWLAVPYLCEEVPDTSNARHQRELRDVAEGEAMALRAERDALKTRETEAAEIIRQLADRSDSEAAHSAANRNTLGELSRGILVGRARRWLNNQPAADTQPSGLDALGADERGA